MAQKEKPRGWRRVRRIVLRTLLVIVLLVVTLVVGVVLALRTDWGHRQLREQALAALGQVFAGKVRLGGIDGPVLGDVTLLDVGLDDIHGLPAVRASRVRIQYRLRALLSKRLEIERVEVDGLVVSAVQEPAGGWNLQHLLKPQPEKKSPWKVDVEALAIDGARVELGFLSGTQHLDDVSLSGSVKVPDPEHLAASARIGATWREQTLPLGLEAKVERRGDSILVPGLEANVGAVTLLAQGLDVQPALRTGKGRVQVVAPEMMLHVLLPGIPVWGDVNVSVDVAPGAGPGKLDLELVGSVGTATFGGDLVLEPGKPGVSGNVYASSIPLARLVPSPDVPPATLVSAKVELTAQAAGAVVTGEATVGVHVLAPGPSQLQLDAQVVLVDRLVTARSVHLQGDLAELSWIWPARLPPARGRLALDLTTSGQVELPATAGEKPVASQIALTASVRGQGLAVGPTQVGVLELDVKGKDLPDASRLDGHLELYDVIQERSPIGRVSVVASPGKTGRIAVSARSWPRSAAWLIETDSIVELGRVVRISLERHHLRARGVDWVGAGGLAVIEPGREARVSGVAGNIARGHVELGGRVALDGSEDVEAEAQVSDIHLADLRALMPGVGKGRLDATVSASRKRGVLSATVSAQGSGVVLGQLELPVDGKVDLSLGKGQLVASAEVKGEALGTAKVKLDLVPPRDVTNARAWKRLGMSGVRELDVHLKGFDLAAFSRASGKPGMMEGRIDADMDIGGKSRQARMLVRVVGMQTQALPTPVDLVVTGQRAESGLLKLVVTGGLRNLAVGYGEAQVVLPARPFDVVAWQHLDESAVKGAWIAFDDLSINETKARMLGLTSTWEGKAKVRLEVGAGLSEVRFTVRGRGIKGGPLRAPVGIDVDAVIDQKSTRGSVRASIEREQVLVASAEVPLSLPALRERGGAGVDRLPITGEAKVPGASLAIIRKLFGLTQPLGGTVTLEASLDGTVGAPLGKATLEVAGVDVGEGHAVLESLRGKASWDGTDVRAELVAQQGDGGNARLSAELAPLALSKAHVGLVADRLDLAPLAVLGPPSLLGTQGIANGKLDVHGLDAPEKMTAQGKLTIKSAQVPLGGSIGTLRNGEVMIGVDVGAASLVMKGQVGRSGTIAVRGLMGLTGLTLQTADVEVVAADLRLITAVRPAIDAKVKIGLRLKDGVYAITARVSGASVDVPKKKGADLHAIGAPADMVFVQGGLGAARAEDKKTKLNLRIGQETGRIKATLDVILEPTRIRAEEVRTDVKGTLHAELGVTGTEVSGVIEAVGGDVSIFGQRYRIDRASVRLDGSTDPALDIRLVREFPELTLYVQVGGHLSLPTLELTSEPGTYTQGQLFGFLLGGSPGGAPGQETRDAASGVASSLLSQKVTGYVNAVLPMAIRIDTLRYSAATATESAAFAVGKWLNPKIYLEYRGRTDARPDENRNEAAIEYWLTRTLLVQGTAGDRGVAGIDLLWIRRW